MRPSPTPTRPANFRILKSLRPRLIRGATAGLIATVIFGMTGCKSVPFTLPTPSLPKLAKPDLSKLAFWKSENLVAKKGDVPKPPSLSFDSSPIKQAIASTTENSKSSANAEIKSLRNQIASTKAQLAEPIREPYKAVAKSTVAKLDSGSGSASRNKLPNADLAGSKITQAQQDFQAALASSSKAIDKSIGGKVADLKTAGNDFAPPKSIKSGKTNVDNSLLAVNKSLYNAQGKLASTASDTFKDSFPDDQLSLFEQRLKKGTEKVKGIPAQVASSGSTTKPAANAFGGAVPPKPLPSPTLPKNSFAGSGTSNVPSSGSATKPAANTFGGTVPPKPLPSLALLAKDSFAGSGTSNVPNTVSPPITPSGISTEMAELKAQLAQLRSEQQKLIQQQQQQLAVSRPTTTFQSPPAIPRFQPTNNSPPIASQPDASEFVANLTARPSPNYPQTYPSTAPLRTASSANNVSSSAPQNVLRSNFSPVSRHPSEYPSSSTNSAPPKAAPPAAYPNTQYPSTPHNAYGTSSINYSASAAPIYGAASRDTQASFQERGSSNLVITASTPVEPAQRHVSNVNIPDAVLQGTSNYAPGTVHALR